MFEIHIISERSSVKQFSHFKDDQFQQFFWKSSEKKELFLKKKLGSIMGYRFLSNRSTNDISTEIGFRTKWIFKLERNFYLENWGRFNKKILLFLCKQCTLACIKWKFICDSKNTRSFHNGKSICYSRDLVRMLKHREFLY